MANSTDGKPDKKVLFIRIPEEVYNQIASLADADDRSINWMATSLLKQALANKETSN